MSTEPKRQRGRPKLPPRTKFPIDIDKEILARAKEKFPDLHSIVKGFITDLSNRDPLDGDPVDY